MFIGIALAIITFAIALGFAFASRGSSDITFEERLREMSREPDKIDLW